MLGWSARLTISIAGSIALVLGAYPARAQFDDTPAATGPKFDKTAVIKLRVGLTCTAVGGPCAGIRATLPVPTEWPEQKVVIANEDVTPTVKKIEYRDLQSKTARQMLVNIPNLPSGEEAHAYVTFEVTKRTILPPDDKDKKLFKLSSHPEKEKQAAPYLSPSPYIDSQNPKVVKLAKDATEGKDDWDKVEAIYNTVQEKLTYKNGPIKGAVAALNDGTGDCEEYASLFIAMCRSQNIPARMVRVPTHVYCEFFMLDKDGKGAWLPCQSAGTKSFGGIPDERPILQKGDNFHDPDRPTQKLIYVNEFMHGLTKKGSGTPKVQFTCEEVK